MERLNGFVHSVKCKPGTCPRDVQFTNADIAQALDFGDYNSARGFLTNKQGRSFEITLDDDEELERILSEGLDFPEQNIHVEVEELESTRMVITVGNIPIEAHDENIIEVIEAHGAQVEKMDHITQQYRGNEIQTGRRRYTIKATNQFQSLPKVVRLFGGRYLSFRHRGQIESNNIWGSEGRRPPPKERSYASVAAARTHEAEVDNTSENQYECIEFTTETAMDWEGTIPDVPLPPELKRFTIRYFEWLQENLAQSDPRYRRYVKFWEICIDKVRYDQQTTIPSEPTDIQQTETANVTTPSLPAQLSPTQRCMEVLRQCETTTTVQIMESGTANNTADPTPNLGNIPIEDIIMQVTDTEQQDANEGELHLEPQPTAINDANDVMPEPVAHKDQTTTGTEASQQASTSAEIGEEPKVEMEWDGSALIGPQTRPMEPITVISDDDDEQRLDITPQVVEDTVAQFEDIKQDEGSVRPATDIAIHIRQIEEPETKTTEIDLRPDYQNQASASQSLAPPTVTTVPNVSSKKKRRKIKVGTDSDAGVVPPTSKKANKPDGHHLRIGTLDMKLKPAEAKKIREKVEGNIVVTHKEILMDTLLNHGKINNMLNHQAQTEEGKNKMHEYYGYLYFRFLGPMDTGWCNSQYLQHTPFETQYAWDAASKKTIKYNTKSYTEYLDMLNMPRRTGKS